MTHKEMTKHIRRRLKASGIKARCKMQDTCGVKYIVVAMDKDRFFGSREWLGDEAETIAHIASCNRLTGARGSEIDPQHYRNLTGKEQFDFEFNG